VTALTDASVLALDRTEFQERLGPLIPKMAKDAEVYLKDGWKSCKKVGPDDLDACFQVT